MTLRNANTAEREMSEVIEIVRKALIESGHDGLYNEDAECACLIADLQPCGEDFSACRSGYRHTAPKDSGYDFYVKDHKP